jgi:hypothetical protein
MSTSTPRPGPAELTGDAGIDRTRQLLDVLVTALREHLEAVEARAGESDPAVYAAFDHLRESFEAYEETLYDVHDEVTPFVVLELDEEDDEDLM